MLNKLPMRLSLGGALVFARMLSLPLEGAEPAPALPTGTLYYTALADDVWQIFSLSLPGGKPVQLTRTLGDKREPVWVEGNGKLLARGSNGDILSIPQDDASQDGKTGIFAHFAEPVANFSFFKNGKDLLITHLISRTYRKQWIYTATEGSPETKLFAKPGSGSYRSVRISPDNRSFACTVIQTFGEERLAVGDIATPSKVRFLTEEGTLTAYPCWSSDGRTLYFTMTRRESGTRDLCSVDISGGEVSCLASTPDWDESSPHADNAGGMFFGCSGKGGQRIGYMNLADGKISLVEIAGRSKEPFFKPAVETGKGGGQ